MVKDFGYIFYSTVLEWCDVIEDLWALHFWEFRLIKSENKAIGCCGLYSLNESTETLWLGWFGLIPEYRNKGLGVDVLKYLEQEAKKVDCKELMSYVDKEGAPLNFYKREGFEIIGTVAEFLKVNDMEFIDGGDYESPDDFVIRKFLK